MKITMVLDVICAHSYLAYHHLQQALQTHRAAGGSAEVTFLPFQLDPAAPPAPEPLKTVLQRKFGPAALDSAAAMAKKAAGEGLVLDYDRAVNANTRPAHLLITHAERHGRAEEVAERLFRAHFTDGLDIADAATLGRLAAEAGLHSTPDATDEAELTRRLEQTRALNVRAVPVFLADGTAPLVGDQSRAAFEKLLAGAPTA
ncbi:DsbA family protein [Streptomyces sp. NPDC053542]|uniref:DsbA family protein n=1 Tax=Streptomyces sp. NPDC053542 TaxID=3365710 RepID=UPI0037D52B57